MFRSNVLVIVYWIVICLLFGAYYLVLIIWDLNNFGACISISMTGIYPWKIYSTLTY